MKTEFLTGLGLEKEVADKIFAEHGKTVESLKAQIADANTTITALKSDLGKMKSLDYEGLQKAVQDAQERAQNAEKDRDEKIAAMEYDNAVNSFAGGLSFSSDYARKGFVADLKAQGFKLKNGELLGAGDYVKQVKQSSPETFKPEPSGGAGFSDKQPPGQENKSSSFMDNFIRGKTE